MDELGKLFSKIASLWGYIVAAVGVAITGHRIVSRYGGSVRRAISLSDGLHDHYGDDAAAKIIQEIRGRTRDGAIQEIRLTLLEESLGAGIYVCDPVTGGCLSCNTAIADLFGLDQAAFRGAGWLEGIRPEDRIACYDHWQKCVKDKIPYEYKYTVRNQRTHRETPCVTRAYPAVLSDGTLLCYVGTVEEVRSVK